MASTPPETATGVPCPTDPDRQLAAATAMDAVTLHVRDLALVSGYYRRALALGELDPAAARTHGASSTAAAPGAVVLGRGGRPLVVLVHAPGLPEPRRGQAGLFHTALLYPDPAALAALAAVVASAAQHPLSRFVGSADDLVSQAFCSTDPEGNGIELGTNSAWTAHVGRPPG